MSIYVHCEVIIHTTKGFGLFCRNRSKMFEVTLISDESDDNVRVRMISEYTVINMTDITYRSFDYLP